VCDDDDDDDYQRYISLLKNPTFDASSFNAKQN
jgi:hypothetical protein